MKIRGSALREYLETLVEAPALLDLVHDVVSAGVKDATPEQEDGGFGFFGAIAEMIEAENAASR